MALVPWASSFDIEHPLGDDAALPRRCQACVLDGVFQIEQDPRLCTGIALINQHRAAFQKIAMALKGEVDDGVEQRMTRADEGGQRVTLWRYQRLLKGNALIARQHGFTDADQPVAVSHGRRNMGDFYACGFTLLGRCRPGSGRLPERNDSM